MLLSRFESRVDELATDLAGYRGHRTIWIDIDHGEIVHAEPDDLLEEFGWQYVATVFQPDHDQLTALLLRAVPVELDRPSAESIANWHQAGIAASLVPA